MEDLVNAIRAEPELAAWLATSAWRKGFDRGSLTRALDYTGDVRLEKITRSPDKAILVEARVAGSRANPYHTLVGFEKHRKSWSVTTECACPVGLYCKHGAAVILLALERMIPTAHNRIIPAAQRPSTVVLDRNLADWLDKIRQSELVAAKEAKRAPTSAESRFLAFCLEPVTYYQQANPWYFFLRLGNYRKDGGFTIQDSMAKADPSNPPKYMTREDFIPASLYHQLRRKRATWDELRFEGEGWDSLLDTALATGRFFVLGNDKSSWLSVQTGPDLPVVPSWEILADGSARPKLEFQDEVPRILLPTLPPRYLNRATGTLGFLTADLAPGLLASWMTGPTVPAAQVELMAEKIQTVSAAIPPPVDMETIEEAAFPPRPVLFVRKKTFGSGYYSREIIHGVLKFIYGDSKPLLPLSNSEPSAAWEIRAGRRYHIPRNLKAERAAEKLLFKAGFEPLHKSVHSSSLDAGTRRAVIPSIQVATHANADTWLELLASPEIEQLRAKGWTIDIDPRTGLLIHDAGDFFPTIETDPDHGIDWFRFDADFEIDGRRMTLIPIIVSAIRRNLPAPDSPDFPEYFLFPCENPEDGSIRFPARRLMELVDQVRHLFMGHTGDGPIRIDRLGAAGIADSLAIDNSATLRALAQLARNLRDITSIPATPPPESVKAGLRHYQLDGFRWLQFLSENSLHGILADDMGLGKTLQTLAHLAAETAKKPGRPSLVVAPTSVVSNWAAEAEKFTPRLTVLTLHGKERAAFYQNIPSADVVLTSYALLTRDFEILGKQDWHLCVLDEAQYIKNSKAVVARNVCQLRATHRLCLSGTPMENHLGELWSLMRFLMPGFLGDETTFNSHIRRPIERDRSTDAQLALNRRVSPLILRRTKDAVATELPPKTEIIHRVDLTKPQADLYESVRAAMDKRVRDAISEQGLAKSHIIVLDALLKLRQICCHPGLLKTPSAQKVTDSAKLAYLTDELLPTLVDEGRRILLFSSFTSMLSLIQEHLEKSNIPFLKLTGQTTDRAGLVKKFQEGETPVFLISLKAGGTGLNLTAADTVIHYDPWWNPAAENQATDRAHRIGQTKPVFIHKLICQGTIEERILDLQKHKAALVEALLSEETSKLKIDSETLSHLLAPLT